MYISSGHPNTRLRKVLVNTSKRNRLRSARLSFPSSSLTGTINIIHRLLAVAARLLVLVESLALRHRDVHTVRRTIRLNPSRSLVSTPLALICARDPVLVPSGPNPLVMLVRHLLLLGVTVCLQDLFFVAIISVASSSWPDLCGDYRSPASRDRWLSSPSLPCSVHLCFSFFLIILVILSCSWVCSSALHVVDWKRLLSVLMNTPEPSSDLTCAFLHCCCPAQCPRGIPNTPPAQRVSIDASR